MPLVNATANPNFGAISHSQYQIQRERNRQNDDSNGAAFPQRFIGSRSTSDSALVDAEAVSNPLGAKDVVISPKNRIQSALALKIDVPDTLKKRSSISGVAGILQKQSHGDLQISQNEIRRDQSKIETQPPSYAAFDDTTSFNFDDDDSSVLDNENLTAVYRGAQPRPVQSRAKTIGDQHKYDQDAFDNTEILKDDDLASSEDWPETIREERQRYGLERSTHSDKLKVYPNNGDSQRLNFYRGVKEKYQGMENTPSRAHTFATHHNGRMAPVNKTVSFDSPRTRNKTFIRDDSPELTIAKTNLTIRSTYGVSQPEASNSKSSDNKAWQTADAKQISDGNIATRPVSTHQSSIGVVDESTRGGTFESSRASDYPTSSEDEVAPSRPRGASTGASSQERHDSRKRHREEEMDYNLMTIKTMRYEDLVKQHFDTDPQDSAQDIAFDFQDDMMTLSQRMNNLNKMSEDEQKNMFRKQDDEEWAQIGSWFIGKFQEDLKRLMNVRVERRKISMKFENETHRRQKDIEWHSASINDELTELRRGGGALIEGKEVPSRRSTPQRK